MSRLRHLLAVLAVVASVEATGLAGVIRHDTKDSLYLSLGNSPQYASVGQIYGVVSEQSAFYASGTLIDPQWVLTAGHVVDSATSLTFSIAGTQYTAGSWIAHPNWNGDLLAGYDIGLVRLDQPVYTVTPAVRYTGSKELGNVATAVGFGMTGTGNSGANKFDGKKRGTQNVIDQLYNPRLLLADFDNPNNRRDNSMGSAKPLALEGLIAPGDSGGGLFITTRDGTFLVGVHSFVAAWDGNPNSDYGDISGHVRVSAFNSWINDVIANWPNIGSASASSIGAQSAAAAVPEPSTLALLAAGVVALSGLRAFKSRRLRKP